MRQVLKDIVHTPLLWLLIFVPIVFAGEFLWPQRHTLQFLLCILAIVPLAAMMSRATESVAHRTGDTVGGLLNATLGNLTEMVITLTALAAGQYLLVKATIAGAIVANSLFMLGASFLIGGLKYKVQEFNAANARFQASLLFVATVALIVPSAVANADRDPGGAYLNDLSLGLAVILIVAYGLGMFYSLRTHASEFASVGHGEADEHPWPLGIGIILLVVVTVVVALVSHVFVASLEVAAHELGMSPAFVGFIVVAIIGAAAEMLSAFTAARKNRLDLSVGIALGSSAQFALFVAPFLVLVSYFLGPQPMNLQFWPGAVLMMFLATLTTILVTSSGRASWFPGVMLLVVYGIFGMTLYLLPPPAA